MYGGICECKATCIYSEKGPWSEVENMIDYRNPEAQSDSDDSGGFIPIKNKKMNHQIIQGLGGEEFKMVEDEDDCVDLLAEKEQSSNINDFYAQEELDDLKNQIRMNLPGLSNHA